MAQLLPFQGDYCDFVQFPGKYVLVFLKLRESSVEGHSLTLHVGETQSRSMPKASGC